MAEDLAALCERAAARLEARLRLEAPPVGPPLVRLFREAGESFREWPDAPVSGMRREALELARVIVAADKVSC